MRRGRSHHVVLNLDYMKKILTLLFSITAIAASAALPQNGYYRVQNYMTDRYAYITDNRGRIDYHTTSVDLAALQLWKGFDKAISDPATVIYIEKVGNEYDLKGQGCSVYSMMEIYVRLREASNKEGNPVYCYATAQGVTRYLGDAEWTESDEGGMSDGAEGDYRLWRLNPIDDDNESCFGVQSTVQAGDVHWAPFYASFPFAIGDGMEAYIVKKVDVQHAAVVIEPVADGLVPPATPVLIKCVSDQPLDNKLNIGVEAPAVDGNLMKGVYFCNTTYTHKNCLPYSDKTMRVLRSNAEGKLVFAADENLVNVPANSAYLPVDEGSPAELQIMTEQEYNEMIGQSAIDDVMGDHSGPFDVYNLSGVRVRSQVTSLDDLPAGIYIAAGKKIIKR